jgi:hypothetical protein
MGLVSGVLPGPQFVSCKCPHVVLKYMQTDVSKLSEAVIEETLTHIECPPHLQSVVKYFMKYLNGMYVYEVCKICIILQETNICKCANKLLCIFI